MMKFFRKHNKKLLVIFMSLLMIVFVGGSALESLLQSGAGNVVVARYRYGDITQRDVAAAKNTTILLARMGYRWSQPMGFLPVEPLNETDWVMLVREAKELGIKPDQSAAARSFGAGSELIAAIARANRVKREAVVAAMAELNAVQSVVQDVGIAAVPSEADLQTAARDGLETVSIRAAMFPASAFEDPDAAFTDEQVAEQFNAHRAKASGGGIDFGYRIGQAVKLQYIKIDRDAIAAAIPTRVKPAKLEREARRYYDENKKREIAFVRPPEPEGESDEDMGPPAIKPPQLEWHEAKDAALEIVARHRADDVCLQTARVLIRDMEDVWFDLKSGEDRYKTAPADVADPAYYERVVARAGTTVPYPAAVSVHLGNLTTRDKLAQVAGIGSAVFGGRDRAPRQPVGALAFRVQGLAEVPDVDRPTQKFLSLFETSSFPLTDPQGNVYVFRVVAVQDEHPAETIDEVRDDVVADLRVQLAYETAKAHAERVAQAARTEGLAVAFEADGELAALKEQARASNVEFYEPAAFSRTPRFLAWRGRVGDTQSIGPKVGRVRHEIIDACFALEADDDKIAVMELRKRATVMIVEWVETTLAREDEYQEMRTALRDQMGSVRYREAWADWLDPKKLRVRNQFELVQR